MEESNFEIKPVNDAGKSTTPSATQNALPKTVVEEFLCDSYEFRHNVLSRKYEYRVKNRDAEGNLVGMSDWSVLSEKALNSITMRMRRELDEERNWKTMVQEAVFSNETLDYDPIADYLNSLPEWDGVDRVRPLFRRLNGIGERQVDWCASWLRSAVAHWLQLDQLHGNEQVLTLISREQGLEKSTFLAKLLPPHLMCYFIDHVNLGNKFDKEMVLTCNLVANIDEIDQIKPGQQAQLKQLITKFKVNGRPIYGRAQEDRRRYASFTATTNEPRPLKDPTGSRRYLCVEIANGEPIDNRTPIDYEQLYAQVKYEVVVQKMRYWFTQPEVREIEKFNLKYQHIDDLETMVTTCFRRPDAQEVVKPMLTREVAAVLAKHYPELEHTQGMNVKVGRVLKSLNFEHKMSKLGSAYLLVPVASVA